MRGLTVGSYGMTRMIILVLLPGAVVALASCGSSLGSKVLTDSFSEPLNGVAIAKVDINASDGNLTIDRLTGGEEVLASGALQYFKNRGLPTRTLVSSDGQATLTLRGSNAGRPWFRFPWAACNGATEWQIHLNPMVVFDITAHSDGGNVKLNLASMTITRVLADTGGGNMDVVLPDDATNLSVTAKTGAGNVTVEIGNGTTGSSAINASSGAGNVVVRIPGGIAARIRATTGPGKVIVDPQFSRTDDNTYQSPGYDSAANRIEIIISSGVGNVSVSLK